MSAIFISHSSHDTAAAADLALRLRTAGYQSLFLDFDPADGIPSPFGFPLSGHSGAVMNLAFTPDGRQLVSGSYPGQIFT